MIIITKEVYTVDNVNTPNHNPFFFSSQYSNNSISFPISNKMYGTKHTIDSTKVNILKIVLEFAK